ncbi:MAG: AhpC/TSA family [Myxococcales bacterium]|nr:AhpC/TSA family [Myxococcales bacterium]
MTLLAISVDEPAASRSFAGSYGITYPLLSDLEGTVSRAYVGVDGSDTSIPGIVVIRRDGQIVFRQIASGKDDRLTAAQLLAEIDRTLGVTAGAPGASAGYPVLERLQLRVELGGGQVELDDWRATVVAAASAQIPIGRHLLVGPMIRYEPLLAPLDLDLAVTLRAPILADAAAVQLTLLGGYTAIADDLAPTTWNAGVRGGVWVALDPSWALSLDAGIMTHDGTPDLAVMFGVSRLIEIR